MRIVEVTCPVCKKKIPFEDVVRFPLKEDNKVYQETWSGCKDCANKLLKKG